MTPHSIITLTNDLALVFYRRHYPRTGASARLWMLPGLLARNAWEDAVHAVRVLVGHDAEKALAELAVSNGKESV